MRRRRKMVAVALVGAGLIAMGAQAVAHPGQPAAAVAVVGDPAPVAPAIPVTEQPVTVPPGPAATNAPAPPVPVSVAAAPAPAVHGAARPASPAKHPAVATPPPATGGGHIITTSGLWLMARDGSGLRRVADNPESMVWSPDDGRVALGRHGGIDILSVADGSTTRLVTFAGSTLVGSLAWSPDGRLIAANVVHDPTTIGATRSELVIVDVAGGASTSLGSIVGSAHPTWSAKGCLGWAFATVEIWCPGRPLLSLPPFPGSPELVWSPDGARYAINSSDDAAPGNIRTYAADGSGRVDLGNPHSFNMQWVSNGQNIVFQSLNDKFGQVWIQPVNGGSVAQLLSGGYPFALNGVDDGVIFDTGHTLGHNTIWSMSISDRTQHQLATVSAGGGAVSRLTWAPDGRGLLVDAVPSA